MHIEIHTPELEQRVRRQIQSGQFHDVDELLTKALDALEEKEFSPSSVESDDSGAALLTVLQNSPYPEIDLAPPRDRVLLQVRDIEL
jgi:Arc/MetJ-type ribon-helix-helix transcriptional regulator